MSKSFRLSKKRVLAAGLAVLLVILLALLLYGIKIWDERTTSVPSSSNSTTVDDRAEIFVNGEKYVLKDNIQSVLFLGIDSYETSPSQSYVNGQQADLLMLLVLDHESQAYTMLQINRDTMATFQTLGVTGENGGSTTAQIALSHAYGTGANDSSRNTTKAVSNLLYGVEIPHFATIRMSAIPALNDAVGGVTVELLDDFTVLDSSFTKGATVTLTGEQATAYVQYRGQLEDSTNVSRMARQRQYMAAWATQLETALQQDEHFVSSTMLTVADDMITDMTAEQMEALADCFSTYTSGGILQIAGESVKGEDYMEFHVDEEALQKQVLELFYTRVE